MLTFLSFSNPLTPVIYTLSLHDALPIYVGFDALPDEKIVVCGAGQAIEQLESVRTRHGMYRPAHTHVVALDRRDRKSTRLNSSHVAISYAVCCLKKKTRTEPRMSIMKHS